MKEWYLVDKRMALNYGFPSKLRAKLIFFTTVVMAAATGKFSKNNL